MSLPQKFLVLVLALACQQVCATETPPPRQIRFTVFSATSIEGLAFFPAEKKPLATMTFYPTARSPEYVYRGAPTLRFFSGGIQGDGRAPRAVAEMEIPADSDRFLLLFSPMSPAIAGGLTYRVFALDDSAARSGPGTVRILNLSGLALRGTAADRALTLGEGLNPPLRATKSLHLDFRAPFRGRLYPAYAETIELKPGERALLILFPPFRAGSLEVQSRLLVDEVAGK